MLIRAPERADGSRRIENPYYEEWMKVESESRRLGLTYNHYRDLLLRPGRSEEGKRICWAELRKINAWVMKYTRQYAWAIPNDKALEKIAKCTPLVEVGAGTGYWAWLLRQLGVDIFAVDRCPPGGSNMSKNGFHPEASTWTEVFSADETVLDSIKDRSLFLCWPPSDHPMAFETLSRFKGNTFSFVGEDWPSCATGNKDFFELLHRDWVLEADCGRVRIPQWPGRKDFLWVYRRRL
jgi:hypothetical protein